MAHDNIYERRDAVYEMIKSVFSEKDISDIAGKFKTTKTAIKRDIHLLHFGCASKMPSKKIKNEIKMRDNNQCQYCGVIDDLMVIEHVVSSSLGGNCRPYNLVVSCHSCNMRKRANVWIPNNIEILKTLNKEWHDYILEMAKTPHKPYENWTNFIKNTEEWKVIAEKKLADREIRVAKSAKRSGLRKRKKSV